MAKTKPEAPATDTPAPAPDVPASSLMRAVSSDESAALAALAEAGIAVDAADYNSGLSEVLATDLKTPYKLFNLKKADGIARIAQDQFLDTMERTVSDRLNIVLLDIHKTHAYEVYNGERNVMHCFSFDRQTGIWQLDTPVRRQGVERACKGCPDQNWREEIDAKTGKRKRVQPCAEVWNAAAYCIDTNRVCLLRFKRTSLKSIQTYVQAHHVGRLGAVKGGKRGERADIPLCVYRVSVTLQMDKTGNFAVPILERGAQLATADIKLMYETTAGVRETFEARMRAADESAAGDGGGHDEGGGDGGDTSFDTHAMDAENAKQRGTESFVDPS